MTRARLTGGTRRRESDRERRLRLARSFCEKTLTDQQYRTRLRAFAEELYPQGQNPISRLTAEDARAFMLEIACEVMS